MSLFTRLFFPPRCAACRTLLPWGYVRKTHLRGEAIGQALCADCRVKWEEAENAECGVCASRVRDCLCMPQALRAARVHALFKLTYYVPGRREQTQNRVVYHIKEENEPRTPYFLAERLAPSVAEGLRMASIPLETCVLTYLPRTARAVRLHGIDQSKNLARELSRVLGIPVRRLLRRRKGANRVQKKLSLEERLKNAKNSFLSVRSADCVGKTVLLVDDIVTTGAGMAACARILSARGARRVLGVAVAVDEVNRDVGVMGLIRRDAWDEKRFFAEK